MDAETTQRFQDIEAKQDLLLRRLSRLAKRLFRRIDQLERWKLQHEATVAPLVELLKVTSAHVDSLRESRSRIKGMVSAALVIGGALGTVLGLVLGR